MKRPTFFTSNEPLATKSWFHTGGPAHLFCRPQTADEMVMAITKAHEDKLDYFILGAGANILMSDDGFAGLVIQPALDKITTHIDPKDSSAAYVTAQAGVSMERLILFCLEHNIIGLEEFSGIPGTVGGSVYINIHYFRHLLSDFMVKGTVLDTDTHRIYEVDASWFSFAYNYSTLHTKQHILIDATFKLKCVTDLKAAYARGRHDEIIRHRRFRYPNEFTCGSFFANFSPDEVCSARQNKQLIYVAYYLDKIGVKGSLRKGDAMVSHRHANMLVNLGSATSQDIIDLARTMQKKVYTTFGLLPRPECQLIGFDSYPLYTQKTIAR